MRLSRVLTRSLASVVFLTILLSALFIQPLEAQDKARGESLAPFVPTPYDIVERMLVLAGVGKNDVVYDLGCGDGRIVIMAAEKFGARGVGVDFNPVRVEEARAEVKKKGLEDKVEIILQDALKVDLSPATVVTLYLLEKSNVLLKPNLEKYLKPGSRVVSHSFDMPGWKARKTVRVEGQEAFDYEHTLFLWIMGEQKEEPK